MAEASAVEVAGRTIEVSHPDKVMFPGDGITKGDLVDYYARIAEVMLPHVRDRPLTQQQFPGGLRGGGFWRKQIADHFPEWIGRVTVETHEGPQKQILANDPAALPYMANQNCVTPHVWTARADKLTHPDQVIFDLDPEGDEDFPAVKSGARTLRGILEDLGLTAFVKTTGSKGLHVVAPLKRTADYERVLAFARSAGERLIEEDPEHFTPEFRKGKRGGRIFVDVLRNRYAQTAVPAYAVRARPGAPVAAPLEWEELRSLRNARKYTVRNLSRRMARRGDPWADMARKARALPKV
jgi:bifunctional non-homologous end joining protein LigD